MTVTTTVLDRFNITRDSVGLFWSKWVGFAMAAIPALAALGVDIERYGIPRSWAPYIGLASLFITVSSAQHRTSELPGEHDDLPLAIKDVVKIPGGDPRWLR